MRVVGIVLLWAGVLCALVAGGVGIRYAVYQSNAYFAPKEEGVRRDVMVESRAYSEAATREIYRLKLQYQQAKSDDERSTIRSMALHEAAAFDTERLPADLRNFINTMGGR